MALTDPEAVAEALRSVVASFGPGSLSDAAFLRNVLADVLPAGRSDVRLVLTAAEASVAAQLTAAAARGLPLEVTLATVAAQLVREWSIDADSAREVVAAFGEALELPATFRDPRPDGGDHGRFAGDVLQETEPVVLPVVLPETEPVPRPEPEETRPRPPLPDPGPVPGPPRRSRLPLVAGLVVLVLALAGGVVYALAAHDTPPLPPVSLPETTTPPAVATPTPTVDRGVDNALLPADLTGCVVPTPAPTGRVSSSACTTSVSGLTVLAEQYDTASHLDAAVAEKRVDLGYGLPKGTSCPEPFLQPATQAWSDAKHPAKPGQFLDCARLDDGTSVYVLVIPAERIVYTIRDRTSFAELDSWFQGFTP